MIHPIVRAEGPSARVLSPYLFIELSDFFAFSLAPEFVRIVYIAACRRRYPRCRGMCLLERGLHIRRLSRKTYIAVYSLLIGSILCPIYRDRIQFAIESIIYNITDKKFFFSRRIVYQKYFRIYLWKHTLLPLKLAEKSRVFVIKGTAAWLTTF